MRRVLSGSGARRRCSRSWWQRRPAPCRPTRSSSPGTCSGSASSPSYATPAMAARAVRALAPTGTEYPNSSRPLGSAPRTAGRYGRYLSAARGPARRAEHVHHARPSSCSSSSATRLAARRLHRTPSRRARARRRSRPRRPTTTPPSGPATSARCTTSRCSSATPIPASYDAKPAPSAATAAPATTRCATTTWSSRTAPSPWPATSGLGQARHARVVVRRRQRAVELHRRPHRPRLAGGARRHRQVRRRATPTSTGPQYDQENP